MVGSQTTQPSYLCSVTFHCLMIIFSLSFGDGEGLRVASVSFENLSLN